jgi:PqqD family protein of HPr-rel-A system
VRWQLADTELQVRHWADETECVVFSPLSGEVHLLNLSALALLDALARQPLSTQQLSESLARTSGRPPDDDWAAAVGDALTRLDGAGLIEPRAP